LLALIVSAAETGTAMPPDRVNFVDEMMQAHSSCLFKRDRARGSRPRDEHFHEVRTGNEKKGTLASPAIARASSVFARARRPDKQHALGNSRQLLELLRIFQELNNLLQLFLASSVPATSLTWPSSAARRAARAS